MPQISIFILPIYVVEVFLCYFLLFFSDNKGILVKFCDVTFCMVNRSHILTEGYNYADVNDSSLHFPPLILLFFLLPFTFESSSHQAFIFIYDKISW